MLEHFDADLEVWVFALSEELLFDALESMNISEEMMV